MTRKDYVKIADVMNRRFEESTSIQELNGVVKTINTLADMLAEDNERFIRARFTNACVQEKKQERELA